MKLFDCTPLSSSHFCDLSVFVRADSNSNFRYYTSDERKKKAIEMTDQ